MPGSLPAATLIAFVATAGEPTLYGRFPEFPADATTITPSEAAAFAATESAFVFRPYGLPRDMLITSTWSDVSPSPFGSVAISIAATTFAELVDPRAKTLKIKREAPGAT